MKTFKYYPVIEVGDVFTRMDRNGKIWKAEVVNRTEYFVDVKKTQPYQIKVADEGIAGQCGCWHYEDAEPTTERCMLHRYYEEVEDGEEEISTLLQNGQARYFLLQSYYKCYNILDYTVYA